MGGFLPAMKVSITKANSIVSVPSRGMGGFLPLQNKVNNGVKKVSVSSRGMGGFLLKKRGIA